MPKQPKPPAAPAVAAKAMVPAANDAAMARRAVGERAKTSAQSGTKNDAKGNAESNAVGKVTSSIPVRRSMVQQFFNWLGFHGLTLRACYLILAGLLSLCLHAVLLSLRFVDLDADKLVAHDKQLEIVLVNARHKQKPKSAQALAQANLEGGGTLEENRRATTFLPSEDQNTSGDDLVETNKRVQQLQQRQQELLAQATRKAPVISNQKQRVEQPDPEPGKVSGLDLAERARAFARAETEIANRVELYNQRPRTKYIGASTEEYRFAQYVEDWRQKVERVGNLNYPENARGRLYGSLRLTVYIRADGTLERVELNKSSGYKELDQAAMKIVRLAAPFSPLSSNITSEFNQLAITRTWTFTKDDQVQSSR